MFLRLKEWRQERIIKRSPIKEAQWRKAFEALPLLKRLNDQEKARLKRLAILFLHYKSLAGIAGLKLTTFMRLIIALQACLPILNLGLDCYNGWISVLIYPGAFSTETSEEDEYGVMHQSKNYLNGEAWLRGPVILSWDDALDQTDPGGRNVVIHEFAHKLDMQNGRANGLPPLHKGMSVHQWSEVFNKAFADLDRLLQQGLPTPIDSYAATSASEFFAVFSELFFQKPLVINQNYPKVYQLLVSFYKQNPLLITVPTSLV
ncbi:MAG: zinc-dependent peptidase [Tatlockia sp.]|nr:zinc-dependent peptidase [Tatlockia sp.]